MKNGQLYQSDDQIQQIIQQEYQKYRQRKKIEKINSEAKKSTKQQLSKQNIRLNTSPQSISFAKIKQITQTQQKQQKLLDLLQCQNYADAKQKIQHVNNSHRFLSRVKQMTVKCQPHQAPTLSNSWKFIKNAVSFYIRAQPQELEQYQSN